MTVVPPTVTVATLLFDGVFELVAEEPSASQVPRTFVQVVFPSLEVPRDPEEVLEKTSTTDKMTGVTVSELSLSCDVA